MPADVEMIALVGRRARDAADVNRIGLQDGDVDAVFREQISCRQSRRPCADNRYFVFIFCC